MTTTTFQRVVSEDPHNGFPADCPHPWNYHSALAEYPGILRMFQHTVGFYNGPDLGSTFNNEPL